MPTFKRDDVVGFQIRDQIYCATCVHDYDQAGQEEAENAITLADEELIAYCDECEEWL